MTTGEIVELSGKSVFGVFKVNFKQNIENYTNFSFSKMRHDYSIFTSVKQLVEHNKACLANRFLTLFISIKATLLSPKSLNGII